MAQSGRPPRTHPRSRSKGAAARWRRRTGPLLGHDGADQPAATRYNAQIAVDGAHQIIISQRVQTSPVRRAVPQATPHPPGMSGFRTSHRRAMDACRREQRRTARRWPLSACVGSGGERTTGGRRPARSDRVRQRISAWGGSVAGVERGPLSDPGLARSRIRRALRCDRGPDAQFGPPDPDRGVRRDRPCAG
jgi:hypothetical protein